MPVLRAFVILLTWTSLVAAADWPQWRGPHRSAVVMDFKAPMTWPKELHKKWYSYVGDGVATPALVGDRLYAFGYQDGKEVVSCLEAGTGKELWNNAYPARAASGAAAGFPGARSSPAVAEGKVVTLGVQGTLSCLDAEKGTVVWRKDSTGRVPGFSTASSPLLADGLCVVQVGGDRDGGAVVAFDLAGGKEKWRWSSDGTRYASPMLATLDGLKAVVVETAGTISAVNLADGKLL
jgi:outer membrane protein assembly factor BamB